MAGTWNDRLMERSIGYWQGWVDRESHQPQLAEAEPWHWLPCRGRIRSRIRCRGSLARDRSGLSLVELLVVVAIIGILAGLLLPAVQAARESARGTTCQHNLRQLAMAVLNYEGASRRLPAAAVVSEAFNPTTCTGCWNPWSEAGMSSFPPGTKHGTSWIFAVLPFLEQAAIFTTWNRDTNVLGNAALAQSDIPTLYCPSRRSRIRINRDDHRNLLDSSWRGGGTDYGGCYGRGDGFMNDTSYDHRFSDLDTPISGSSGKRHGMFMANSGRLLAAATDGLANTIMLGELQRLRPIAGTTAANTYNRTSHDGWAVGGVSTLFVTATDPGHSNPGGMNNLFFESPGSEHLGGCFFALADGSVQWIDEFIDAKDNNALFPLLGSIQDGAVAGLAAARR